MTRGDGVAAGFNHAVANDVFNEDWNEGLNRCGDELLRGLLTPAPDLGGSLLVVASLVAGQLVRDLGHGSRDGWRVGRGVHGVSASAWLIQCLSGNLFAGVRPDDVQGEVTAAFPDQDDTRRLVTGEAQQFDRVAGDLGQWRRLVPAPMTNPRLEYRDAPIG